MPRHRAILLLLFCAALNAAGFMWGLFEPVPLYDELAHTLTPFVLVAITSEFIYRSGGNDEFFGSRTRSLLTGTLLGLVGAVAWEIVEVALNVWVPAADIYNPLPDTLLDVALGTAGGAVGAFRTDRYLARAPQFR